MGSKFVVILAVCIGLLMDEYIYQIPSALSGQFRNSTACQAVLRSLILQQNESAIAQPDQSGLGKDTDACLHFGPLRYNLLYVVPALSAALTAPFYQLLLRRFGTATISVVTYTLSFLSM